MSSPSDPSPPTSRHGGKLGVAALVIGAIVIAISQWQAPSAEPTPHQAPASRPPATSPGPAHRDGYQTDGGRAIDDPDEVREIGITLADIADGPPDRFRADREVYENRNRQLPEHPLGWWHAFTVVSPGEHDRGPRRLVVGNDGEVWFTRDHYRTFVRLRITTALGTPSRN